MHDQPRHVRAKMLRETLGFKTLKALSEKTGIDASTMSNAESPTGHRFYTKKDMAKLREMFNVNTEWLLHGYGEMFLSGQPSLIHDAPRTFGSPSTKGTVFPTLQKHGEKQFMYGPSNVQPLPIVLDTSGQELVTIVPEFAFASYAAACMDPNYVRELPVETVPEDLKNRGTVRKFQVYGDSMEPEFLHGDWVYATFVEITKAAHLDKIRHRHLYIIITRERSPMLKRVGYLDGDEFLQCYSSNPEHKPFPLPLQELKELWYVRRRYTGNFALPKHEIETRITGIQKELFEVKNDVNDIKGAINKIARALPEPPQQEM